MKTLHRSLWIVLGLLFCGAGLAYGQEVPAPQVDFPYSGNRTAVWVVANLHILFAAFILGAPIFVVVAEWLGYKNNDPKYDRLAKEVIKVTVILYSMTALTGGLFIFVLLGTYPDFSTWLIQHFFLVFAVIYPTVYPNMCSPGGKKNVMPRSSRLRVAGSIADSSTNPRHAT